MTLLNNKALHIIIISGYIFTLFAIGHIGLVRLYRLGTTTTMIAFILLILAAPILIILPIKESHFVPLLFAFVLWAAIGEAGEHLGISDIVNFKSVFLVILFLAFYFYAVFSLNLPKRILIGFGFFIMIWVFHFIMVNQFENLGKEHFTTYISAAIFVFSAVFAMFMAIRTKEHRTIFTALFVSSAWSILEYLWGWNVIPKPW